MPDEVTVDYLDESNEWAPPTGLLTDFMHLYLYGHVAARLLNECNNVSHAMFAGLQLSQHWMSAAHLFLEYVHDIDAFSFYLDSQNSATFSAYSLFPLLR